MKRVAIFFTALGSFLTASLLTACQDDIPEVNISNGHSNIIWHYDPSILFEEWECQNTIKTRSGEIKYPDWYGGCFEENGLLVIQCTNTASLDLLPKGAKHHICEYAYNELDSISDIIETRLIASDISLFSNVLGFGISGNLNRIQIILYDTSDIEIQRFKHNIYSEEKYITFKNINELTYYNPNTPATLTILPNWPNDYIVCGYKLLNPYTSNQASLGYRVKDKNGNKGFMTAGHFVYEGKYITNADGDTIGLCKQCYRRNIMDASYCELTDNNYKLTNNIRTMETDTLSISSVQPIEGAPIILFGYNITTTGNVLDHSFKFSFVDDEGRKCVYCDQILLNFRSLPGNSGGLVCHRDNNTQKIMTVGIVGGNCTTSVSPVLYQTVAYCCKQNVIQTVMGLERY